MGFFKDFKDDVSQAVNELVDDAVGKKGAATEEVIDDDMMVDTLEQIEATDEQKIDAAIANLDTKTKANKKQAKTVEEPVKEEVLEEMAAEDTLEEVLEAEEETKEDEEVANETSVDEEVETTIIRTGFKITGDVESVGAIELLGTVIGNVTCQGKLSVSGTIKGNTHSASFFSNKAEITGNICCDGAAKIGNGTVIIGDLTATSAVIAGAIKGDIDVKGPVILDTTAIVMGNIKSAAVQINNGAVIEGHCSQCYAKNSPSNFFKDK